MSFYLLSNPRRYHNGLPPLRLLLKPEMTVMSSQRRTEIQKEVKHTVMRGNLFILSAPSGAGKTTLCDALRQTFPDLIYSISHTTRKPRKGEKDGVDYFFVSEDDFKAAIENHHWAEYALVHGNYYGTSRAVLDRSIQAGRDVLLDIDVEGTKQVLRQYPDAVTIFIMAPSMAELRSRLIKRGTDSAETIEKRLQSARKEIAAKKIYRHIIVNDRLGDAIRDLTTIIHNYRDDR